MVPVGIDFEASARSPDLFDPAIIPKTWNIILEIKNGKNFSIIRHHKIWSITKFLPYLFTQFSLISVILCK